MAHIWTSNSEGNWNNEPISSEISLSISGEKGACVITASGHLSSSEIRIISPDPASPSWTLMAGRAASVSVNGERLITGIRVLRDRDEIAIGGFRCFFSTEELARVVAFPGLAQPAFCPRCKQKLQAGDLAVACPRCHSWHHQTEQFPCWTYGPVCSLCQAQPTALDTGYSWTPESL